MLRWWPLTKCKTLLNAFGIHEPSFTSVDTLILLLHIHSNQQRACQNAYNSIYSALWVLQDRLCRTLTNQSTMISSIVKLWDTWWNFFCAVNHLTMIFSIDVGVIRSQQFWSFNTLSKQCHTKKWRVRCNTDEELDYHLEESEPLRRLSCRNRYQGRSVLVFQLLTENLHSVSWSPR